MGMGKEKKYGGEIGIKKEGRTVIFAVPSHPQPSRLDRGKAEADGLAQCRSIDVRYTVLVAHATI